MLAVGIILIGAVASAQPLPTSVAGDMRLFENEAWFHLLVDVQAAPHLTPSNGNRESPTYALEETLTRYLFQRATVLGFPLHDLGDPGAMPIPESAPELYFQVDAAPGGAGVVLMVTSKLSRALRPSGELDRVYGWVDVRVFSWRNAPEFESEVRAAANEMLETFVVRWRAGEQSRR